MRIRRQNLYAWLALSAVVAAFGATYQWQESRSLRYWLGDAYDNRGKLEKMLSGRAEGRWLAAARLAEMKDPRSVAPLLAALRDVSGTRKVCRMCVPLGETGDARAVQDLVRALNNPSLSDDVHQCAAKALLNIGDPRSEPGLIRALQDDTSVIIVIRALGRIGSRRALPDLKRVAARHPEPMVRREAKAALSLIETRREVGKEKT
ncbi:MAG: HEAT repeat domain-containing protein [Armatimonadetes bacterium]|nr:HEAT repeat domain-containing protein [Armatimonadota bacterium]